MCYERPKVNIELVSNSLCLIQNLKFNFTLKTIFHHISSLINSITANTDTFEIHFNQAELKLTYYDTFDIANNRITFGPLKCYKGMFNTKKIIYMTKNEFEFKLFFNFPNCNCSNLLRYNGSGKRMYVVT
jgi:hypothetical protein